MIRRWLLFACGLLLLAGVAPAGAQTAPPQPEAASYILVEPRSGTVLTAEDPDRPLPMASITKVMTALVVLERADLDDRYTVPPEALVGGSTADLEAGEQLAVRDLLTGLLVASGNDAAITLAVGLAGSVDAFVELMNARAAELGLAATHFQNPTGLDAPGHLSTAREIVALSRVAMADPLFRELVGARRAAIPGPGGEGLRDLESNNLLLDAYPEADGIKTGMTDRAGYTLAAHAVRPALGIELYLALIGGSSTEGRARDGEALLRWGFAQYARPTLLAPGAVVGRAEVGYRPGVSVSYRVDRGIRPPIRLGLPVTEEIVAPSQVEAPVREGQVLGSLTVRQGGRVLATRRLVAAESVAAPGLLDRIGAGLGALLP